jgi:hypothetical protein
VKLSSRGKALLGQVKHHWQATNAAASELDGELSVRLTTCTEEAIAALERKPFKERIRANRVRLDKEGSR